MALYRYEAMDDAGRLQAGSADAGTPAELRALLRAQGLHATWLQPAVEDTNKGGGAGGWVSLNARRLEALSAFARHLALLLKAGLPLTQSLQVLSAQVEDKAFREVVLDLGVRVREGASFDTALAAHPAWFPPLFVCVAQAGAAAGNLGQVLGDAAIYYTRQKKLRDKVVSALTYPALMATIGLVVLVFLLAFVVPKVTAVLLEQKQALPWPTEILLAVSGFIQAWWWLMLLGTAFLGWLLSAVLRTASGRRMADRLSLSIPVIGDLLRKQAVARWADTMSNLLSSGIPVAQALGVVRGALGNVILAEEVERFEEGVRSGKDLSELLKSSPHFPGSVGFVAGVGEESGELPRVLREVAAGYHEEVELVATRLTDLVNPVLIVFLGLVVGFIVAAILLPITDFGQIR